MANLFIHGQSVGKYLTKQRIEEDHIEPLTIPYREAVVKEFIAIDPDVAWMPLSLALSKLMRRLWNLIVAGPHFWTRLDGDEYLYQVLRKSLFNIFPDNDDTGICLDEVRRALPEKLPSASDLGPGSYGYLNHDDQCFDVVDEALIHLAVDLAKPVDTRMVDDALQPFRRRLDNLEIIQVRKVLERAEELDLSNEAQRGLAEKLDRLNMSGGDRKFRPIAAALVVLERIEEVWTLLYGPGEAPRQIDGDEVVYQSYRAILLRMIRSPRLLDLVTPADGMLPRILPVGDELRVDNSLFSEMPTHFERLRKEFIATAFRLGEPTEMESDEYQHLHTLEFDESFEEEARRWEALQERVRRVRTSSQSEEHGIPARSRGRPKVQLDYEVAVQAYWDLVDELGTSRPTRQEIVERLAEIGHPCGVRVFGEYCRKWREEGQKFPPPRPELAA